jgi:hypothetical protein
VPAFAEERLANLLQTARGGVQRRAFRPMIKHLRAERVRSARQAIERRAPQLWPDCGLVQIIDNRTQFAVVHVQIRSVQV